MPEYKFKAKSLDNRIISGSLAAKDENELYHALRGRELILISAKCEKSRYIFKKLKSTEVAEFSRQVSDMINSGIPILRAVGIMRDRSSKPYLKSIYSRLGEDISQGHTLSEAMTLQPGVFPDLFVSMIAAGESGGQLVKTARKMGEHYEKEHRLNSKVKSAMIYPSILLILTAVIVLAIFLVILPQFFDFLSGMELPAITRLMLWLSTFISTYYLYIAIGIVLIVALVKYLLTKPKVRTRFDRFKLRIPKVGKLLSIIYTARFARTLSSLYSSGLPMINALGVAASTVGNKYIERQFDTAIADIRNGESLSSSIEKIKGFDPKLISTIYIAEESGKLDTMLENSADSYDFEADAATTRLITLLEPVMLVIMAVVIGTIMLSVLLPMMNMYQGLSQGALV